MFIYCFFTLILYALMFMFPIVNQSMANTIVNAVIVGCFSLGGIVYTQRKTKERYESELNQKDNQMRLQEEFFNDMIIYMSNYPHELHALIKLKGILDDLLSVYCNSQYNILPPIYITAKIQPTYIKFQNFVNSPLYYYLNEDITSQITPIFDELHKKYDTSHQDAWKIQMNRNTTLSNDQLAIIKNIIPEIENKINEITKKEINNNDNG